MTSITASFALNGDVLRGAIVSGVLFMALLVSGYIANLPLDQHMQECALWSVIAYVYWRERGVIPPPPVVERLRWRKQLAVGPRLGLVQVPGSASAWRAAPALTRPATGRKRGLGSLGSRGR